LKCPPGPCSYAIFPFVKLRTFFPACISYHLLLRRRRKAKAGAVRNGDVCLFGLFIRLFVSCQHVLVAAGGLSRRSALACLILDMFIWRKWQYTYKYLIH